MDNEPRIRGWKHPCHARGIRSPSYLTAHVLGQLTDKRIEHYKKQGRYGTPELFRDPEFIKIIRNENLTSEQREWELRKFVSRKYKVK